MIDRFYLKSHLSFVEVELLIDQNLVIFTGPSGAGKSILMQALLTLFGLSECDAKHIEASFTTSFDLEAFGIENDEPNIFKYTKEKSARYFINNQQVSKKSMKAIGAQFVNYLTLREFREFENENLLHLLDTIISKEYPDYRHTLTHYKEDFKTLQEVHKALKQIEEEERKITDLKEFAAFEIEKIEEINPKVDEYEALMVQKKELSKKEKIESAIAEASEIFTLETKVTNALSLLEIDSIFFDEAFNELRVTFESATERLNELDTLDIESMLERLENLSSLKSKYGSIEATLEYLEQKKVELLRYENIAFEKSELEKKSSSLQKSVATLAKSLTKARQKALLTLRDRVEYYLKLLYLENIDFSIRQEEFHALGSDHVDVSLKHAKLEKVSSGELNRIRLATLAASSEFVQSKGGVLILDEIDANLSGKESMSIAKVLQTLSHAYQIFAISHQPQLTSKAQAHFMVHKEHGISKVTLLEKEQDRIAELSRMISGDAISEEAMQFAQSLLAES